MATLELTRLVSAGAAAACCIAPHTRMLSRSCVDVPQASGVDAVLLHAGC